MKTIQASELKPGDVIFCDKVVATVNRVVVDDTTTQVQARCFSLYTGLYDRWVLKEQDQIYVEDSAAAVTEALFGMIRELRMDVARLEDRVRELEGKS